MLEKFNCTHRELADKLGRDRSWVTHHLRLLELEGLVSRDTLFKLFEKQARAILSAPEAIRERICRWVDEFTRKHGEPPSVEAIRDYIWQVRMEELVKAEKMVEEAGEAEEAPESAAAEAVERRSRRGKPKSLCRLRARGDASGVHRAD